MPKQSHTFCHCESVTDVTGVAIRNIPYPTPPVSLPRGRVLYSTARVSGKRKERQIAQKFFWKAGRERSAVLPRPGGLKWCLAAKNHPAAIGSRVKRSHNSFGPGTGSGPGAAYCVSGLAE